MHGGGSKRKKSASKDKFVIIKACPKSKPISRVLMDPLTIALFRAENIKQELGNKGIEWQKQP